MTMERPSRSYDSPARRAQHETTRAQILDAAADLAREQEDWHWHGLTFRAVAERAGVGERTVYRHFPTAEELHDAVMRRLVDAAGVSYEDMTLEGVALLARRLFLALPRFRARPRTSAGPAAQEADQSRREALLRATTAAATDPESARLAAAALDVLSIPTAYERLVGVWGMTPERAADTVDYAVSAIGVALAAGTGTPEPPA